VLNKTIAFSLWGNNPKYTAGAIKNAELSSKFYTDSKQKYYIGSSVPNQIVYLLEEFSNVEIIEKEGLEDWTSLFWRFEASYDDDSDVVIFRDTDSRLSLREELAVKEWLDSDKTFHIMRDHPYHKFPILGGMWGLKKSKKYNLQNILERFIKEQAFDKYGTDYEFLGNILYPKIIEDVLIHDEFFSNNPFPSKRRDGHYVGKPFEYDDRPSLPEAELKRFGIYFE